MDFGANKTPIEIIKERAFGVTYIRYIYSGVKCKWYRSSWKELNQLKNIDKRYCCSTYYDFNINKYDVKRGTLLKFWGNKGWIESYGFLWLVSVIF